MTAEAGPRFTLSQSQSQEPAAADLQSAEVEPSQVSPTTSPESSPPLSIPSQSEPTSLPSSQTPSQPQLQKRKQIHGPPAASKSTKKQKKSQAKLSAFFSQPAPSTISVSTSTDPTADNVTNGSSSILNSQDQDQIEADYRLALQLSGSTSQDLLLSNEVDPQPVVSRASFSSNNGATPLNPQNSRNGKATWTDILAPLQPPKCTVHNERARELTVTKPGPNKGKNFFICSRPVGPGYDRGKTERLREEVDHQYRCNFFKWASEVKKASMKEGRR